MRRARWVACALVVAACGAATNSPPASTEARPAVDAGSPSSRKDEVTKPPPVTPARDASPPGKVGNEAPLDDADPVVHARLQACGRLFDARHKYCGSGPTVPAGEIARERELTAADCARTFTMVGITWTPEQLDACAAALEPWACSGQSFFPRECDFRGALAAGTPCFLGMQCASGACGERGGDIPNTVPSCFTCLQEGALGGGCNLAGCPVGALCVASDLFLATCKAQSVVPDGAACDWLLSVCNPGSFCDSTTHQCAPRRPLGSPCRATWGTECAPPLRCSAQGTCVPPSGVGEECEDDRMCSPGLACDGVMQRCVEVQRRAPGEDCDGISVRCVVGECTVDEKLGRTVCPLIAHDGEPCNLVEPQCDGSSVCFHGKCTPTHAVQCP